MPMPKMPHTGYEDVVRGLKRLGFEETGRRKGSHLQLLHPITLRHGTVPCHKGQQMSAPLMSSILKQAGVTVGEFVRGELEGVAS